MYKFDEVRHVHLEPTTRCNAACPMCARNACGATVPGLELTELTCEDVRSIFPESFLSRVTGFDLCGAYGDPAAAGDLIESVKYIRGASPGCVLTVYSNGGLRSPQWWERLAEALGAPARAIFAIDGLGEINGIHRRGVVFEKVIENARAYIAAGGDARWEFLVFRHNEHQVEAARALSESMGFREFSVKKTARFLEPAYDYVPEFQEHKDLRKFPIHEAGRGVVGYLEPPGDPALVNETTLHFAELLERHGSLDALFSATPINCRVLDTGSVFVSARGYAFPCCWTYVQATRPALLGFPEGADRQLYDLVQATGGFELLDARRVGLRAAVEGPLFGAIESSWACSSVAEGRLKVCARACGVDFPAYFDQFSDEVLLPRGLRVLRPGSPAACAE